MEEQTTSTQSKTLGLLRWVQFAYLFAALLLFWFFDKLVVMVWTLLSDSYGSIPEPESYGPLISAVSGVIAGVAAWRLYLNPGIKRMTQDVVDELARVTWPARREVSYSTVIVIITSIVAAIILGIFDTIWSTVTDLIY